jgi:uncharacterized membrane protein
VNRLLPSPRVSCTQFVSIVILAFPTILLVARGEAAVIATATYRLTDFGTFGVGISEARAINAHGDVVIQAGQSSGYLFRNGIASPLQSVAGYSDVVVFSINDSDQIAGSSAGYAVIWNGLTSPQELFSNNNGSAARAINNASEAVGGSYLSPRPGSGLLPRDASISAR